MNSSKTVKLIIIIILAAVFWSAWQITRLSTEYSVTQFYPQNHPLLKQDREIRKIFNLNQKSPLLFVLTQPAKTTWLHKNEIRKLKDVSLQLQQNESIAQVLSMPLIEGASQNKNDLNIGSLFDRTPSSKWKNEILNNPLLFPLLVSSDFKSTLIAVEPNGSSNQELTLIHKNIFKILKKTFPTAQIESAGVPLIQVTLSKIIRSELFHFFAIAVFIFCGIFYLLFSHWSAVICAFIALITTNILSMALLAALKIPMNSLLVTLPIIVSVAVMSLLIHTLHLWSQKIKHVEKKYSTRWPIAVNTFLELALPNFLGAWTTGFGFLALSFSNIPIIREYGWVVAAVVTVVSVFAQLLILVSLPLIEPRMKHWFDKPAYWSLISLRRAKPIYFVMTGMGVLGVLLSSQLNFSGRLFDDLPKNDGVRATTEWIDSTFGGLVSYDLVLNSPQPEFWKDPQNLKRIHQVSEHLRLHPNVGSVVSISDFFQSGIPENKKQVAETFFLFSMAEKNPVSSIMSDNAQKLRLMIRLKDRPSNEIHQTRAWVRNVITTAFSGLELTEGGQSTYAHLINQEVSHELVFGFWQSLLLIGIFLIFMFKSFRWALIACIPNLIPPAILMGAMAISGVAIKPGVALIFSIATGFSFNNTVYLLGRLKKISSLHHLRLRKAMIMESNPCFFESLVMFVGFSIFLTSNFSMNQTFGVFMMISITAGFFADLFFLPALLTLYPKLLTVPNQISNTPISKDNNSPNYKIAASILLAIVFIISPYTSHAKQTSTTQAIAKQPGPKSKLSASEILKKSQLQLESKDEQANIEMKIIEKNGEIKNRILSLKVLKQKGYFILARIQSPADLKGMGFLGSIINGKETQWIYLPSSGQVRRIVTGSSKGGLLGSELSAEDLNSTAIKSSSLHIFKENSESWWIEVIPAKGTSIYSKVITQISKANSLPQDTFYYSKNKLIKTVSFKNYLKLGNVWRAQSISIKNQIKNRGTEIKFSNFKINTGLKSQDFSQSALKEDE